jgi:hypothetical protein
MSFDTPMVDARDSSKLRDSRFDSLAAEKASSTPEAL